MAKKATKGKRGIRYSREKAEIWGLLGGFTGNRENRLADCGRRGCVE